MYVFMSLSNRVTKDHSYGGTIAYADEWHLEIPGYEESSGKSSHDKYMSYVSREYEFIFYACIMPMCML